MKVILTIKDLERIVELARDYYLKRSPFTDLEEIEYCYNTTDILKFIIEENEKD